MKLNPLVKSRELLRIKLKSLAKARYRSAKGFSLVVTILMMALLLILGIAALGLSSIETRKSTRDVARQRAMANARLALNIAIGELQKELGPDRRVSVPSEQISGDKGNPKHWVGVYDSWLDKDEERPSNPSFRKWLISGNQSVVNNISAPKSDAPLAKKMVNMLGSTGLAADKVEAGLIPTDKSGAYAWWISDNSMKAKLGNAIEADIPEKTILANIQSASRFNHQPLFKDDISAGNPGWNTIASLQTASFLGKPIPSYFHHATNISDGLVTDVRKGGFRQDMSILMDQPLAKMDQTPFYTVGNTNGMSLYELWPAHHIWEEIQRSGLPVHADGNALPSGTPFLRPPGTAGEAVKDPFLNYRQITKVQFTCLYSLITEEKTVSGDPAKAYDLYLVLDPIYTIWNPFDVAVTIPSTAFTMFKNWGIPYDLNLTIRTSGGDKVIPTSIPDVARNNYMNSALGRGQALVLRPGEVQMLSQSYKGKIDTASGVMDAKLGWNFGAGFKFPIDISKYVPVLRSSDFITYELKPNAKSATQGWALVMSGHSVISGNNTSHVGSFSVDFQSPQDFKTKAIDHQDVFPVIPRDASAGKSAADLVSRASNEKWPICVFTFGLRTERDSAFSSGSSTSTGANTRFTGRYLYRNNPKAYAWDLLNLDPNYLRVSPLQIGMRRVNSLLDGNIANCTATGLGYFGLDHNRGTNYIVTHSVPTAPIHSLGALQHAIPGMPPGFVAGEKMTAFLPMVSHPVSNSFASSMLAPSAIKGAIGTPAGKWHRDLADHSYYLNRALWDQYFYSSIASQTPKASANSAQAKKEQKSMFQQFVEGYPKSINRLPDSRMKPVRPLTKDNIETLFDDKDLANHIASNVMIDGAFNVNSVSVEAWTAFLSSLKGSSVPVRHALNPESTPKIVTPTNTPVLAGLVASEDEIDSNALENSSNYKQWTGFRGLTDDQIKELAAAVVKQVKLRGPFLSLSDFVNRRPGNDKTLALSGALQSALDDPSVSINSVFREGDRSLSNSNSRGFAFPEAEDGPKAVGSPGYVKQGDLLTPLGPMIAVRGDTYTIRTCGEAYDTFGKLQSRVYCEAIVQRMPEYVDPSELATTYPPKSKINETFGRKFEIISFRYLNNDEITN